MMNAVSKLHSMKRHLNKMLFKSKVFKSKKVKFCFFRNFHIKMTLSLLNVFLCRNILAYVLITYRVHLQWLMIKTPVKTTLCIQSWGCKPVFHLFRLLANIKILAYSSAKCKNKIKIRKIFNRSVRNSPYFCLERQ